MTSWDPALGCMGRPLQVMSVSLCATTCRPWSYRQGSTGVTKIIG